MYYIIKTLIIFCVFPLPLCIGVMCVGLIFLWNAKKKKTGKIIVTSGVLLLMLFGFPFFPDLLLGNMEQQYVTFSKNKNHENQFSDIKYVVVLAGGHILDPGLPITSQFSYEGLVRLIEGIRLYGEMHGSKLILSGGRGRDPITDAGLMSELSIALGVDKNDIILESESMNTFDEARYIKPIVGDDNFLLVTSASHMFRSVVLFRELGMKPIPAPTGHLVKSYKNNISLIPKASNLLKCEALMYEYLGLFKEILSDKI